MVCTELKYGTVKWKVMTNTLTFYALILIDSIDKIE